MFLGCSKSLVNKCANNRKFSPKFDVINKSSGMTLGTVTKLQWVQPVGTLKKVKKIHLIAERSSFRTAPVPSNFDACKVGFLIDKVGNIFTDDVCCWPVSRHDAQSDGRYWIAMGDGRTYKVAAHRLVLTVLRAGPPRGLNDEPLAYECDHINGICTDNNPDNLQWLTTEEHRAKTADEAKGAVWSPETGSRGAWRIAWDAAHP